MTDRYVALIGAANIDIQGFSTSPIIDRDSNPGRIEYAKQQGRKILRLYYFATHSCISSVTSL